MPGKYRRIGITVPPTKSEAEAHDLAFEILTTGANQIADRFTEPDDDWDAVWIVLTQTQGTVLMPGRGVEKYEMTDAVAQLARRWGAVVIAHLHSSWLVTGPELAQRASDQHGSTEGLPRDEVLLLASYSAGNSRTYTARINRHEDGPPTLGEFDLMFSTESDEVLRVSGAMVDPLMEALQRVG